MDQRQARPHYRVKSDPAVEGFDSIPIPLLEKVNAGSRVLREDCSRIQIVCMVFEPNIGCFCRSQVVQPRTRST